MRYDLMDILLIVLLVCGILLCLSGLVIIVMSIIGVASGKIPYEALYEIPVRVR